MPKQPKPFSLSVEYVETPDAQERLDKAYAIILKAGRRRRQKMREAAETDDDAADRLAQQNRDLPNP